VDEFVTKLEEVLELDAGSVSPDARFDDLPWDSLAALSAMVMIQEEYGVVLTNQDFRNINSLPELWQLVADRKGG
jgi:acyl carrier protein